MSAKVFVSGASGFVAGHVIELLLKRGYKVVGTVRSLKNEKKIEHLKKLCPENQSNLELVEADLTDTDKWVELMKDSDYLIHTASPFVFAEPKDPQEIIKPALEGTENVISAALKNNIKKIVLTSSIVSIQPGNDKNFYTEKDWSVLEKSNTYEKSKHLAEKKAWELIEEHKKKGGVVDMAVINPAFVQGPSHSQGNDFQSAEVIMDLMNNKMPGLAKVSFGYVDVREVAFAHVQAMEREQANGKRYLLVQGTYWLEDVSTILQDEFKQYGYKITSNTFGNCTVKIAAVFDKQAKSMKPMLGKYCLFDNSASIEDLGVKYRSIRETLYDTVYSLISKGKLANKLPKDHVITHKTSSFKYE